MPELPCQSLSSAAKFSQRSRWGRWVDFLDHREHGTSLALFRIACGFGVLGSVGSVVLHGLAPVLWLNPVDGGYRDLPDPPWLFQLLGGLSPANLWSVIAVALFFGLMLLLGLGGRLAPLLSLQAYLALSEINPQTAGADDLLLSNALWLLVLAQSTATLSVDCRLRTGRWFSSAPVPAWPRYLAIYQLVLTYWSTGAQKLGINWTPAGDYSALYYILQVSSYQRWDMSWLAWVYPLTQVATAVTWLWENAAPLLLLAFWYRNTRERSGWLRAFFNGIGFRRLYVLTGLGMHVGIFVLMNVEPFTWVTLSYYVCLFRPEEWHSAWKRLRSGQPAGQVSAPNQTTRLGGTPCVASLRGVLVGLHLVAITLVAFPAPGAVVVDPEAWKLPDIQEDVVGLSERLDSVGITITPQELQDCVIDWANTYMSLRQRVLVPFQPYYDYCGTYQSWRMFGAATRTPTRLHIDVEENGVWRSVYVERSSEHDWLGHWLDHCRFRPVLFRFGARRYEWALPEFAAWVAKHAARDFPDAARVRVHFYEFRTLPSEEVRSGRRPTGHFRPPVVLQLAIPFAPG
jgi:hypothetical protein